MWRLAAIIMSLLVPAAAFAQTGGTLAPCTTPSANGCHIVLDGHAGNPKYGNEAQFLRVANNATGVYHASGIVHNGEILSLRVYVDNDTNPKRVSNSTAAVAVAIKMGCAQAGASSETICATISSPNALPQTLNSSLVLSGAEPFTLSPVENSATLHWAATTNLVTRAEPTDSLLGPGINVPEVEAGYGNSIDITQLVQVHMATASNGTGGTAASTSGQTGGTTAPSPSSGPATPASHPAATPAPAAAAAQPVTVNVTQIQGQNQNQSQRQTGSSSQPAAATGGANSSQPAAVTAQSQSQSPGQGQVQGATATDDATSDDAAIQSAQGQGQAQNQTQTQTEPAATALPDTGATSATGGTLGLTLLLLGFGAYYRSRQSLWRRLRARG
jgi:LPXTG-motif cell wall-anchored protein